MGRLSGVQYYAGHCTTYTTPKSGCDLIQEVYTYHAAGAMLTKTVIVTRSSLSGSLATTWTYDTEGRMASATYPSWRPCIGAGCNTTPGSSYTFAYDTMGRLNTLTDSLNTHNIVTGITYGVANEVLSVTAQRLVCQ